MLYVHIETDRVIDSAKPFSLGEFQYPANWIATPQMAIDLGLEELVRVNDVPADPENYFTAETRTGKYATTTYTRKSDEQIKEQHNGKIDAQIAATEVQQLLPRVVREFLLASAVKEAAALGLTEEQLYAANIGYRKMKDANTAIQALRAQRQ